MLSLLSVMFIIEFWLLKGDTYQFNLEVYVCINIVSSFTMIFIVSWYSKDTYVLTLDADTALRRSLLVFLSLFLFPVLDLLFQLRILLQHVLCQGLSAKRVIRRGQDVSLNVLPLTPGKLWSSSGRGPRFLSPVAAWELDRVLHQLAHDGAAELVW